jgi:hypothetical protein
LSKQKQADMPKKEREKRGEEKKVTTSVVV